MTKQKEIDMIEFNKIIEEMKNHGIKVERVMNPNPNTFQRFQVIGYNYDPSQTWTIWKIRAAHKATQTLSIACVSSFWLAANCCISSIFFVVLEKYAF